jgi:hypothetical protein
MFVSLLCLLLGHKYAIVRRYSATQRRVCCERCGNQWAMNDEVQGLLTWDGEFAELYKDNT